jgi:hypothetical protein
MDAPITDVKKIIEKKYLKVMIAGIAVFILAEGLLFFYILLPSGYQAFQIIIFPAIAFAIFYGIIRQKAEDSFFEQFAKVNGFSFEKKALPSDLQGSLFFLGHSPVGRDLISGDYQQLPFCLFNYRYTVGYGKNSHAYIYTVFRLQYTLPLPPIFLASKRFIFGGNFLGSPSAAAKEKIQLEGDFNDSFNLWTKKGFEIETLQAFTPDVMATIEKSFTGCALEFINNQIYVYSHHMVAKDQELETIYQFVQYLAPKIAKLAQEIKGDMSALSTYYEKYH